MKSPYTRVLDYPYEPISHSQILTKAGRVPFDEMATYGRTPVLAIGSNRAPEQLRRKFSDLESLPVEQVELLEHDVVYAARVSGYGAMPATLAYSPGTSVQVAVTWLTSAQLEIMDASEGLGVGYYWAEVPASLVVLNRPWAISRVGCYVAARGVWPVEARPVALRAVTATGRRYPTFTSEDVLRQMAGCLFPLEPFDSVLKRLVLDEQFRVEVRERLGAMGRRESGGLQGRPHR